MPCAGKTPALNALKSCSNPEDPTSLQVYNDKNRLVLGFGFFVSDVISGVVSGLFGPLHLALGPKHKNLTAGKKEQ